MVRMLDWYHSILRHMIVGMRCSHWGTWKVLVLEQQ